MEYRRKITCDKPAFCSVSMFCGFVACSATVWTNVVLAFWYCSKTETLGSGQRLLTKNIPLPILPYLEELVLSPFWLLLRLFTRLMTRTTALNSPAEDLFPSAVAMKHNERALNDRWLHVRAGSRRRLLRVKLIRTSWSSWGLNCYWLNACLSSLSRDFTPRSDWLVNSEYLPWVSSYGVTHWNSVSLFWRPELR